jgi:site-specific DNA-methyltransferase (adenine-specific)
MKKYQIIYADPPWKYKWGDGGNLAPETHYPTLSVKELSELPVKELRDKNCILALWATCPALPEALGVMTAWGFKYKTILHNWVKVRKDGVPIMGMGSYTRSGSELLILAMRGHIKRLSTKIVIPQVLMESRREHSQKPDVVRENLIRLFGNLPRIELFARGLPTNGWDTWGNEAIGGIDLFDKQTKVE